MKFWEADLLALFLYPFFKNHYNNLQMNVTIKDIARELGICYSSVSRALNGKPGVSEETRKKITETAERMGYRPNELARGLVSRISKQSV